MATATQLETSSATLTIPQHPRITTIGQETEHHEASRLANLARKALNTLNTYLPNLSHSTPYTPSQILSLPLSTHRIPDELYKLPRRGSARHELACLIAPLLSPCETGSLTALIRYEEDKVRLRGWAALQRKYDLFSATQKNGRLLERGTPKGTHSPVWTSRILSQEAWDPTKKEISLEGVKAVPMPVTVSEGDDLAPFFDHLHRGGTWRLDADSTAVELDGGKGEPYYGTKGAEWKKGVLYEDGRMDLCKMALGPDHICNLMRSLMKNAFVRHFLLGNNIVGPSGAKAIAEFIEDLPSRMETWYLAGNRIDEESFRVLVDALVKSDAVTSVWLKRNPLGKDSAKHLFRLITETPNLRTLDVDQTELGDTGVAELFCSLATYSWPEGSKLPLRSIYLNGNGISKTAVSAIGSFLRSPHCGLTSLYMSNNPLGDEGISTLAEALPHAPSLTRLSLQSVGVSTEGAISLFQALSGHPNLSMLDVGQAYATEDLGQAYNFVEDGAVESISAMLVNTPKLAYLNLGACPISPPQLRHLASAVLASHSLLYYSAIPILPDPVSQACTYVPSHDHPIRDPTQRSKDQVASDKAVREHLEGNVRAKYNQETTYAWFLEEEKRWLVNERDVRRIDSVYRNREAGLARRGIGKLVKEWPAQG